MNRTELATRTASGMVGSILLILSVACSAPEPARSVAAAPSLLPANTATPLPSTSEPTRTPTATATITGTPGPTALPPEYLSSYWAVEISDAPPPYLDASFSLIGPSWDGGLVAAGRLELHDRTRFGQILKLRQSGDVAWRASVTAGEQEWVKFTSYLPTSDGGALISASVTPVELLDSPYPRFVPVLLRLDVNGQLLWQRPYEARPMYETEDGGFLLARPPNTLLRLDRTGETVWARILDLTTPVTTSPDQFRAPPELAFAGELPGGDLLVGGYELTFAPVRPPQSAMGRAPYPTRLWFARLGSADEIVWSRYFEFRGFSGALPTSDGGVAVAGNSFVEDTDYAWLLKLTADGEIAFWRRYRELAFVYELRRAMDGGFVLTGTGSIPDSEFSRADNRVLKVDGDGFAKWGLSFGADLEPRSGTALGDGSTVLLLPGGRFYRFGPDGRLPGCEAIAFVRMEVRTTDVIPPPDLAELIVGPLVHPIVNPTEVPPSDQPTIGYEPLSWDVTEMCRHFP